MPAQQPTLTFATQAEWDAWLARHGGSDGTSTGVWLRFAKAKASGAEPTLSYAQALDADRKARAFFATLSSQNRYAILFRIHNVKKAETRARKIAQFVQMLHNGETLHP